MRGKKNLETDIWAELARLREIEENNVQDYDSEWYESLQNEQRLLNDLAQIYEGAGSRSISGDGAGVYEKRAPSNGFHGMRGKKSDDDDEDDIDIYSEKRAPMGFQGNHIVVYSFYNNNYTIGYCLGMRGKKDVNDVLLGEKRAPAPGFFGMRGKKIPSVSRTHRITVIRNNRLHAPGQRILWQPRQERTI